MRYITLLVRIMKLEFRRFIGYTVFFIAASGIAALLNFPLVSQRENLVDLILYLRGITVESKRYCTIWIQVGGFKRVGAVLQSSGATAI